MTETPEPFLDPAQLSLPLTQRQTEVAKLVAEGMTDKQIAAELNLHPNTVIVHVLKVAKRLQLPTGKNTRVLIARWWMGNAA